MTLHEALEIIGGLSKPSKMPCHGWSIPASRCKTGVKLKNVKGSICNQCYALRGNYSFPHVQKVMERRFSSLSHPQWVKAMTVAIGGVEGSGYMRFHDSGDIQSLEHLENIAQVAKNLPKIKFWLPTREYSFVSEYLAKHKSFPKNLNVRLSALMIDGPAPVAIAKRLGLTTSGVSRDGFSCPASSQGNKCLSCRACWDKKVKNVSYKKH